MTFLTDVQELKTGLIIFRRSDVEHKNWYCRVRVPDETVNRYKTISLKTPNEREAKDKAFEHDSDIRFRKKHGVPVFDKTFEEVALEYSAQLEKMVDSGQITKGRRIVVNSYIKLHLIPYMGHLQIIHVGETQWKEYPFWRKKHNAPEKEKSYGGRKMKANGKVEPEEDKTEEKKKHIPAADGTIRGEMATFRAIMNFAADKQYIRERQVPKGKLIIDNARREAFTLPEYRHLHTQARKWRDMEHKDDTPVKKWYRQMAYEFMLVMTNTGMRTIEARNLKWKHIDFRKDKDQSLRFASIALTHQWIDSKEDDGQFDKLILQLLTSRDNQAVFVLMEAAYKNRVKLGHRWWRLLYLCLLWAGLSQLAPWWSEDKKVISQWGRWLKWLRSRPLNESSSFESIDPLAIGKRVYRLEQARNRRQKHKLREKLNRQGYSGLDSYVLKTTFSWLLSNDSQETIEGNYERLIVQKIWKFEAWNRYEDKEDEAANDDRESPPNELGYEVIRKLSKILASSPPEDASDVWKPVLSIGVDGQYAIGHFIDSWFLENMGKTNYRSFEYHWRAMLEFALSADNWSPNRYWYKGQQLYRQLLGFNSGFLKTYQGDGQLIVRMKDLAARLASKQSSAALALQDRIRNVR